jgi:hypothetical protein
MSDIVLPIIVSPPDETHVFLSVKKAESYLEPFYLIEYSPTMFDAVGHILEWKNAGKVKIRGIKPVPPQPDALREVLAAFLSDRGDSRAEIDKLPLAELVRLASRFAR